MPSRKDIPQEFKKRRTRQIIALVPGLIIVAILSRFSQQLENNPDMPIWGLSPSVFYAIFFTAFIGIVIFSLYNWRCPSCNKYLGKGFSPDFCPKCGVHLKEKK